MGRQEHVQELMDFHHVWLCSRMGGHRAAAHALIQRGKEHERQMDVRAAVRSYEVPSPTLPLPL